MIQPIHKPLKACLGLLAMVLSACIHSDFEEPGQWYFPDGQVVTIEQLRNMYQGEAITFDGDYSVYATVTMDDKSGNIYRNAYIQDHTAGINLRLVAPGAIYTGDSVKVYLKGTTLSSFQRMMQIDNVNVDRNIYKLAVKREVSPRELSIPAVLSGNFQGQLISIDQVQFQVAEVGQPFADKQRLQAIDRILEDCEGNSVVVRTSGYASFADHSVPNGSGSLTAIAAQYGNTVQLYIRDINEVQMTSDRCAIPGSEYSLIPIKTLRENYASNNVVIPANTRIEGIVISDRQNENMPGQNMVISDDSGAGITIRFAGFHEFNLGTRVRIVVASPMPMSQFNGLLQLDNVPTGNAYNLGHGTLPTPASLTIAQALAQIDNYESTLVTFQGVTIEGGTTFSGNRTIRDHTGQIALFTSNRASFANAPIPDGAVTITGILSTFNSPQLLLRNLGDIVP